MRARAAARGDADAADAAASSAPGLATAIGAASLKCPPSSARSPCACGWPRAAWGLSVPPSPDTATVVRVRVPAPWDSPSDVAVHEQLVSPSAQPT